MYFSTASFHLLTARSQLCRRSQAISNTTLTKLIKKYLQRCYLQLFLQKKSLIIKPSLQCPSILNMNSLKNNNKMETKVVSFEQMPELIQNLVERIEALEKTVREKQQPQPLEGELMSVEDVCKLLGKSKSAVYRTVRCHDIPFIRQGNRLYFDRPTIKKWLEKKQNIECITNMDEFEKFMTPDPWRYRNRR